MLRLDLDGSKGALWFFVTLALLTLFASRAGLPRMAMVPSWAPPSPYGRFASWAGHAWQQPYVLPYQNALESWLFASNVLLRAYIPTTRMASS